MTESIAPYVAHRSQLQLRVAKPQRQEIADAGWQPLLSGPWQAHTRITPNCLVPDLQRLQLATLCTGLDRRLRRPISVKTIGDIRQVTVLGCLRYTVNTKVKTLRIDSRVNGSTGPRFAGDISIPLKNPILASWIITELGLWQSSPQGSLLLSNKETAETDIWLRANAWRLLKQDSRFKKITIWRVMKALRLDHKTVSLALAARTDTKQFLTVGHYNLVWRNETVFRHTAATNQHLLPLLASCAKTHGINHPSNPVGELRSHLLASGLSKAAWRFVVAHGAKLFREPWRIDGENRAWIAATEYLRILDQCGLPNPMPSVVRALLDFNESLFYGISFPESHEHWCGVPADILSVIFHASANYRSKGQSLPHPTALDMVFNWSHNLLHLPKDQRPSVSDWPNAIRKAAAWHITQRKLEAAQGKAWQSLIPKFRHQTYIVIPLTSAFDLLLESQAMHNCIDSYAEECIEGNYRVFSFRDQQTHKRVATATISNMGDHQWIHDDARGKANRLAPTEIQRFTAALARIYSKRDRERQIQQPLKENTLEGE